MQEPSLKPEEAQSLLAWNTSLMEGGMGPQGPQEQTEGQEAPQPQGDIKQEFEGFKSEMREMIGGIRSVLEELVTEEQDDGQEQD